MKTEVIGSFAAKTHFAALLDRAQQGTVFIVTKRGRPVAQLGPAETKAQRPTFGRAKGRISISPDFDAPLSDMAEYEA